MNVVKYSEITDPIAYVAAKFPGYKFVTIAAVEPFQRFVRFDETDVDQALRTSEVLGKVRIIVAKDFGVQVPEEPDFLDIEEEDEEFVDEEEEPADGQDDQVLNTETNTKKPMNKSKLNAAVTTAFASFTGAVQKALKSTNVALNLSEDNHNLSTVTVDGNVAASFRIQRFPGSDPLLLVSKFSIEEAYRNSGLNRTLHQILDAAAKGAGAAGILATVREDNQLQNIVLEFTGWSPIQSFTNPKSGAGVQIFYKEVGN